MSSPGNDERHLEALVADLGAIVWEAEGDSGRFTFVSRGAADLLGYAPESWTSDPDFWAEHIHPDDRERVVNDVRETVRAGRPHDVEYRFLAGDGRVVWLRDIGRVVGGESGEPAIVRGLMVDVTERRLAEEDRAEAEFRSRRLVEHLPAILYTEAIEDDRTVVVYVSPGIRDVLGLDPEEWLGSLEHWLAHVHPDDRERVATENARADTTGGPYASEYRVIGADGRIVWIHDQSVLVRDEDGKPRFWQGLMLDITERMNVEENLRETEAKYRTLVEQTPVVTYLEAADGSSQTIYISPQVEGMLGYRPEELTSGRALWLELIHPEDQPWVIAASREADETLEPYDVEYRMIARDGRIVWLNDQAVLIRDDEGRPRFWQGVWVDITERRRAADLESALETEREQAAELRALDEMKTTFLQAVSHDLRTPLAAILGLAVTLEREDVELHPREAKHLASRIAANARKLDKMVSDLLDIDRLGRGIIEPKLAETDVGELVSGLVAESDILHTRRVTTEAERVLAEVDVAKVERIVENLLANTVRHTPPTTHVWVRVCPQDDGVLIAVEDDGPGVPRELRATIFEAFRQGPDTPEHSPGVGIGLSLVARFAELHGGRAWVEDREGGGASFRIWLPAHPRSAAPASARQ